MTSRDYAKFNIRQALKMASDERSYITDEELAEEMMDSLGDRAKYLAEEIIRQLEE